MIERRLIGSDRWHMITVDEFLLEARGVGTISTPTALYRFSLDDNQTLAEVNARRGHATLVEEMLRAGRGMAAMLRSVQGNRLEGGERSLDFSRELKAWVDATSRP